MDEKRTDPSGYEPNFVMKDAEDEVKTTAPPGLEGDFAQPEDMMNAGETADAAKDAPQGSEQVSDDWQASGNDQEQASYQTFRADLSHESKQACDSDGTSYQGSYRDPRDAFRSTGADPCQYSEHSRPDPVKDNFGGSPYTGYVDENGNMHYSSAAGGSGQSGSSTGGSGQFGSSTGGSGQFGSSGQFRSTGGGSGQPGGNQHAGTGQQTGYSSQTYGRPGTNAPGGGGFAGQQTGSGAYTSSWSSSDGVTRTHRAKKPKKPKKPRQPGKPVSLTRRTLALLIALCVVVSGLFGFGGAYLSNALSGGQSGSSKTASVSKNGYKLEDATGSKMTVQEVTNATKDSVVEIKTESVSSDTWMQQYVTEGAGSGVIMTADGYIMTNNHVIDGASKITVTTSDDKEYEAKLVGTDSITDIAVLKISAKDLTPVTYGNSDQLSVGDMAVAIGNPLGELGGTVSAGIISALDRELAIDGKTMTLLQTDASINPGNSGGGLFNGDGQLIGVVVAKSSGSNVEGLGFAIPINKAADVAQQLIDKGYVSDQPSTGMSYSESSQGNGMSQFFGNSQGSQSQSSSATVYIQEVTGTNAKKAGFQQGDIVYAVDGTEITSFNTLSSIVTSHKVGDKLTFTIVRGNQTKDIKLTLEEKKASN